MLRAHQDWRHLSLLALAAGWLLCASAEAGDRDVPLAAQEPGALTVRLADGIDLNEPVDFQRHVAPALTKAGCNMGACHGSFQGRGGMQLSLLGYDANTDYNTLFKTGRGRRVAPAAPDHSLLLLKAAGRIPHGGGVRMTPDSEAYAILRAYIAQGLAPPEGNELEVVSLAVEPSELLLKPEEQVALRVTAHWSDGTISDATPWALYDSRDEQVVEINANGRIAALKPGRAPVTVRFMGNVASVRVTIPFAELAAATDWPSANYIDDHIRAEWRQVQLEPAPLADDAEYLRRIYVDMIGTLPTPDEVRAFLASTDPGKRAAVVDRLLERPEFVDFWALRWGDLFRAHSRTLGPKGLQTFNGWIRRAVRENWPVDRIARELLTAQGNMYSNGPVAFYVIDSKPEDLAETTAQVFLGVRLQCARCHHHPMEVWGQDDYYGLAAFFTRLDVKDNQDNGRFGGARLVRPTSTVPKTRRLAVEAEPQLFGQQVDADSLPDVRVALADAITENNPYFARSFANRLWAHFMSRGLVEPVDDFRETNPASHPELLDELARDFAEHGYDVRRLIRTITASRTYQLASTIAPATDLDGQFFTYHRVRRLPAEVLLDAINQATAARESFDGMPVGTRAIGLPSPGVSSYFLDTFGRPARTSACDCSRSMAPSLAQALHLANGEELHAKITSSNGRLHQLLATDVSDAAKIDELFLLTLSRHPSDHESTTVVRLLDESADRRQGWEDVFWSLLNTTEFMFNH